jgi:hypothetical protein
MVDDKANVPDDREDEGVIGSISIVRASDNAGYASAPPQGLNYLNRQAPVCVYK